MKSTNLIQAYLFRIVIYCILLAGFYIALYYITDQGPNCTSDWNRLIDRFWTTTRLVFVSFILLLLLSILLAAGQSFCDYWRKINRIDTIYVFIVGIGIKFFLFLLVLLGIIPIFLTAKGFNILLPNVGAYLSLIFANAMILQIYPHIYNELSSELQSAHIYGAMSGGIPPVKTFVKRICISSLDISKSLYINLLGFSIFVEYQFKEAGSSFQGLAYDFISALYDHENDWCMAFQAFCGIIIMILIVDTIWTFAKIIVTRKS